MTPTSAMLPAALAMLSGLGSAPASPPVEFFTCTDMGFRDFVEDSIVVAGAIVAIVAIGAAGASAGRLIAGVPPDDNSARARWAGLSVALGGFEWPSSARRRRWSSRAAKAVSGDSGEADLLLERSSLADLAGDSAAENRRFAAAATAAGEVGEVGVGSRALFKDLALPGSALVSDAPAIATVTVGGRAACKDAGGRGASVARELGSEAMRSRELWAAQRDEAIECPRSSFSPVRQVRQLGLVVRDGDGDGAHS